MAFLRHHSRPGPSFPALVLFLWPFVTANAQQYTQVSGLVRDPSDAAIPFASIVVVNEDTGFRRSTETSMRGDYLVSSLQPGLYKLTVRKEGFRTVIRFGVKLDITQPARVDFTLPLGSMQETITVEGVPTPVNTTDAAVSKLIGRDTIERIPWNGRALLSLVELAPGTVVTPATRGESGQFTVNGQRPNAHYFTVDGVSFNSGVSGGGGAQLTGGSMPGMTALGSLHNLASLDALEEFRVHTATTSPEFGRFPGAQISLSTRSGSNQFHGSLFYYVRNERLDANDWFANRLALSRAPLRVNDYGAAAGGPIRKNRTFFFVSYEGIRLLQPFAWRTPTPQPGSYEQASPWVRTVLKLFPDPNGPTLTPALAEYTGRNNRPSSLDTGSLRLDHTLTSRSNLFARYTQTPSSSEFGSAQISQLGIRSRSFTLGGSWNPVSRLVVDLRTNWSFSKAESYWRPADREYDPCALEPVTNFFFRRAAICDALIRLSIAGVGQVAFGRESNRSQKQWQILPSVALSLGTHQIRIGADYRTLRPKRADASESIAILADSFSDLLLGRSLWTAISGIQIAETRLEETSLFAQDTWRIHPRLTVTGGLRWEYSPAPTLLRTGAAEDRLTGYEIDPNSQVWNTNVTNLAPRISGAFRIRDNTVLRGGFGVYLHSSLSVGADIVNGGPFNLSQYTSVADGAFVATLLSYGFERDLKMPQIRQWSVSLDRSISPTTDMSVSYSGAIGRYLLRRELGGPESALRLRLVIATNNGASEYHGLQAQLRRRLPGKLQTNLAYTWSHSIDNASSDSLLFLLAPGISAAGDRARSDFDVRHVFNGTVSYPSPFRRVWGRNWSVDGIYRARTGFPINIRNSEFAGGLNYDNAYRPNFNGSFPVWITDRNRPNGRSLNPAAFSSAGAEVQGTLGRNAIQGFGMSQIDMALRREFRFASERSFHLRLEAFNLLNNANFSDPVRFLNNPLFGQSNSMLNLMLGTGSPGSGLTPVFQSGGPRSLQIVARFRF